MTTATATRKFYGNQYAGPCDTCGWVIRFVDSAHPEVHECFYCVERENDEAARESERLMRRVTILPTYDEARHSMEPWELAMPGLTRG